MTSNLISKINNDIRHSAWFDDLDDDTYSRLVSGSASLLYRDGQTLLFSGQACDALSISVSGCVHLYFISEDGHEVIFAELGAGDVLGDVELTLGCTHFANAVAAGETRVMVVRRSAFSEITRMPQMSAFLMKTFARKLRKTMAFAEGMALHTLQTRLARLLVDLARLHGRSTAEGLLIDRAISQEKMGQLINASRPRVNAQLQAWKGDGVLGMRRGRLIILDYRSLKIMSREGATDN